MNLPTLKSLGIRIHSDFQYASGSVDCDGDLEVMGVGKGMVDLRCSKCFECMVMKRPPDMSWRQRKDLQ